jgi:DNA-directed RNA polymerase specialized sigma24 family protein
MPGRSRKNQDRVPDFYLSATVNGQLIDPQVRAALEELWPWFWDYVGQELGDSGRAADLVDDIACRVSIYLAETAVEIRSLVGLCRVAATNLLRSTKIREGRIQYRGLSKDIEASLSPSAPDSKGIVERAIWIDQLFRDEDQEIRTMLQYRLVEDTWDRIGSLVDLTADQARLRFHRALRRIRDEFKVRGRT